MNSSTAALAARPGSTGRRARRGGLEPQAEIARHPPARPQVELLAGDQEEVRPALVVPAVIDADQALADDEEAVPLDDDRRRLVEPDAQQPGLRRDDADQVVLAAPDEHMLVDGHAPEVAEPLLVTLGHHDVVAFARAADQVGALDRRAGRRAADHPAPRQHVLDLALGARAQVGVDQPPLAAAAEPDAPGLLQRRDERLRVGHGAVAGVQHGHVRHAERLGESPGAPAPARRRPAPPRRPSGSARSPHPGRRPAPRTPGSAAGFRPPPSITSVPVRGPTAVSGGGPAGRARSGHQQHELIRDLSARAIASRHSGRCEAPADAG